MDAEKNLGTLAQEWADCSKCELAGIRPPDGKVVIHGGDAPADYLFIYDAPEKQDVLDGYPFQDSLGALLLGLILRAAFPRGSFAYAPLVGCWPYTVLPIIGDMKKEQVKDRDPSVDEVEACYPRISQIIYNIDPRVIFAVGPASWKALVRPKDRNGKTTLTDAAGELFSTYVPGKLRPIRYPVMPLLSPKQIMANPSSAEHGPIAVTLEAMLRAMTYVSLLQKEDARP